MSHPENWQPWDGDERHPELAEESTEIPGQLDIFGAEVPA